MTPDLQREFQLLADCARKQLRGVPESGSYRHVFSIWTMPSFSPPFRCSIYSPLPVAIGKEPFADFRVWRSDLDWEKFRSPVERLKHPKDLTPAIESEVIWLTADEIKEMEQTIRGISIPLYLGHVPIAGCDGTSFEFRYHELFFGTSLHWWENFPTEWRPFTEAVVQIATGLRKRTKCLVRSDATSGQ
jgi:hypothetical protein